MTDFYSISNRFGAPRSDSHRPNMLTDFVTEYSNFGSPSYRAAFRSILFRKTFGEIKWLDHNPALMVPGKPSCEWSEIRPEEVWTVLSAATAVCWSCHIVETFRRRYPELVVDRPWKPGESHRVF